MLFDKTQEKDSFLTLMEKGPVVAPCAYDCVSARILEETGFSAICLSGGELAASLCGFPDIGLVTLDELVGAVDRIASCVRIPMIVDIDTGFGNELNVIRTCKRIAHAGAKAVHLEDQTSPKRCGHLDGKQVIPREDFISKVRAAAYALKGTGCILIARTDSYHTLGFEEAVRRCNEAYEAGADVTFMDGCATLDHVQQAGQLVQGPKMFAMASMGASPKVTYEQLKDWGYSLITMHLTMSGAIRGMRQIAQRCYQTQDDLPNHEFAEVDKQLGGSGFHELFGINEWLGLGKQFNDKIQTATRLKCKEK